MLLVAWLLLTTGTALTNGTYSVEAIVAICAGFVLLFARRRVDDDVSLALGGALVAALVFGDGVTLFAGAALLAVLLSGRAWSWPAVLMLVTVAGIALIMRHPRPAIDVWHILDDGARSLTSRRNMFTSCQAGNTDPNTHCVYPYLPFTSVLQLPFRALFGDVRYSYLLANGLSSFAVYRLSRNAGLATLVLLAPKALRLVDNAWTEPLLLAALCLMVLAVVSDRPTWAIVAFAAALACKQHMLLLVPLAAWWPAFGVRRTAAAVAGAVAVTLPWVLADPGAFKADALDFNLHLPPRADSLSLYTTALRAGVRPHFALVAVLTLVAIGVALRLFPRDATGFALGSAFVLYAFNLLNKQSFFNHYELVAGLLILAAATEARRRPQPADAPAGAWRW